MQDPLSGQDEELFHYTTEAGLRGIIESQALWATNAAFVNDSTEASYFFDSRLRLLIDRQLRQSKRITAIEDESVREFTIRANLEGLTAAFRNTAGQINSAYLTSFTRLRATNPEILPAQRAPRTEREDGVLSQWRAYGSGGGFAIVFTTSGLEKLIKKEIGVYRQTIGLSSVAYLDNPIVEDMYDRFSQDEKAIADRLKAALDSGDPSELAIDTYGPITRLSCVFKHPGFIEEREARIVVVHPVKGASDSRRNREVRYAKRNGRRVPYIALFESLQGCRLPIERIIVGPHPERHERAVATTLLLEAHEIDAEVHVSEIPYIERGG